MIFKTQLNFIKFGFSELTEVKLYLREYRFVEAKWKIYIRNHGSRLASREKVATSRSSQNGIQHPNGCRTAKGCHKQRNAFNNSAIVRRTDYSPGPSRSCTFPGSFPTYSLDHLSIFSSTLPGLPVPRLLKLRDWNALSESRRPAANFRDAFITHKYLLSSWLIRFPRTLSVTFMFAVCRVYISRSTTEHVPSDGNQH